MNRLLITGAAGGLGQEMRKRLAPMADILRLADIAPLGDAAPNEEIVTCDMADAQATDEMVADCDGIVHFGGISLESPFETILRGNIIGLYNLYEAARAHGQPRILFASSNHVTGFHPQDRRLKATDPMRPDSLYGVSKCYGEALASLYHDKFGQETMIVRIGSCFPKATSRRLLTTWMSPADLERLIKRTFEVPRIGCPIIWGVSDNRIQWWDNSDTAWLGWTPQDSSEVFRKEVEATDPVPAHDSAAARFQGGPFCTEPIHKGTL